MTERLFNKAAILTDLHLGKKNNSRQFNVDCSNFIDWFISQAKSAGAETVIFCGDWHDNRRFINVSTLNYSLSNLEKLDNNFKSWYFIPGNHDLYYKEKREISSIEIARNLKNVHIIRDPETINNVAFIPWLVGEEYKTIKNIKTKYVFGHFELPHFLMNQMSEMPDNGTIGADDFDNVEKVFTGHFHKRQNKKNIYYIGSPFPQNYSDAWDDERGMLLLDWDGTMEFRSWPDAPKYRTLNLSDVLEKPSKYLDSNTHARVSVDINLNYDENQFVKDLINNLFQPREFNLNSSSNKSFKEGEIDKNVKFQSVEQLVTEGLKSVDSSSIQNDKLIKLFNALGTKST